MGCIVGGRDCGNRWICLGMILWYLCYTCCFAILLCVVTMLFVLALSSSWFGVGVCVFVGVCVEVVIL